MNEQAAEAASPAPLPPEIIAQHTLGCVNRCRSLVNNYLTEEQAISSNKEGKHGLAGNLAFSEIRNGQQIPHDISIQRGCALNISHQVATQRISINCEIYNKDNSTLSQPSSKGRRLKSFHLEITESHLPSQNKHRESITISFHGASNLQANEPDTGMRIKMTLEEGKCTEASMDHWGEQPTEDSLQDYLNLITSECDLIQQHRPATNFHPTHLL